MYKSVRVMLLEWCARYVGEGGRERVDDGQRGTKWHPAICHWAMFAMSQLGQGEEDEYLECIYKDIVRQRKEDQ